MEQQTSFQVQEKRKIHDIWAFILYIIYTLTFGFVVYADKTLQFNSIIFQRILIFSLCMFMTSALYITIAFIMMFYLSSKMMHLGYFLPFPLIFLACWMPYPWVYAGLCGLPSLIGLIYYFCWGRYAIPYSAAVLTGTAEILSHHIPAILINLLSVLIIYVANIVVFFQLIGINKVNEIRLIFFALHYFWTNSIVIYFSYVFVASIIAYHVNSKIGSWRIGMLSFKNAWCSIGSVCFAALLVALINTLKLFIDSKRNESYNRNERGLGALLTYLFISILLYILEDFVRYVNSWVFPYIAVYGTSYKKSIIESFQKTTSGHGKFLSTSSCISSAFGFLVLFFLLLTTGVTYLFSDYFREYLSSYDSLRDFYGIERFPVIFCISVVLISPFAVFLSMVGAASKALQFIYCEFGTSVRTILPEMCEHIDDFERKQV